MRIYRFASFAVALCLASLATAQSAKSPEKSAEAEQAEAAVREQAKKFYDLLVAGKPRAAEALVCEASKDEYYSSNKRNPRSAEVRSVALADDLKSAKATVLLEDEFPFGQIKKTLKMPVTSNWRLESGQYCYYLSPEKTEMDTPFGKLKLEKGGTAHEPSSQPAAVPVNTEKLSMKVAFSKQQLALPAAADGKDEIVVSNGLNGPIQFQLSCPSVPGLECKMDQDYIAAGKQGKLVVDFKFQGTAIQGARSVTLWVLPFQTVYHFPIQAIAAKAKP